MASAAASPFDPQASWYSGDHTTSFSTTINPFARVGCRAA
jgi:hypothetical protein